MPTQSTPGTAPLATVLAVVLVALAALAVWRGLALSAAYYYVVAGLLVVLAVLTLRALMVANQWEKAVVLRLGKVRAVRGPGLFVIMPFVETVAAWIDQRIQTSEFNAEQALTRDTVPVNVDAIVFWLVRDAERAALAITDYREGIARVAQTSLREMIGASPLSALLAERRKADEELRLEIARKIADWGIEVRSVEIRDVRIPPGLQDAMSRQAQAEREKAARIILGTAEQEVAQKFLEAAEIYANNSAALQLRAMNIIYEVTKERGTTVLIPSAMVDSMNPAALLERAGLAVRPA
jgi:regulator of protease activity HflC (stomatin/prohibitin superfamily)